MYNPVRTALHCSGRAWKHACCVLVWATAWRGKHPATMIVTCTTSQTLVLIERHMYATGNKLMSAVGTLWMLWQTMLPL